MATKYAEWVTLNCGRCQWLDDIGSIIDKRMDPDCETHREFKCQECGDIADRSVVSHGLMGSSPHKPVPPMDERSEG